MSEIGRVTKVFDDKGDVKYRQIYITKDVTLAKGTKIYLNELEDSLANKVKYNIIDEAEKREKLSKISEMDKRFNRETTHVLKVEKPKVKTEE